MNIILFSQPRAGPGSSTSPIRWRSASSARSSLGILGTAFALGMQLGQAKRRSARCTCDSGRNGSQRWPSRKREIAELKQQLQERVDAMAMRLGEVNAHVIRLDALGKRLTEMANIDHREFDFDSAPPTGGPETEGVSAADSRSHATCWSRSSGKVDLRDAQLAALENVILARKLKEQIHPEGRPVQAGFISSYFGERQDPFTGHQAFHKGIDFAGSAGSEVVAVAAGVVTWAGERSGYGSLVEISHGNGYVTRYGHNQKNLVAVGQTVTRGEPIALMGSTGRSTGPHVHFEVLRNGRQVNPASFIGALAQVRHLGLLPRPSAAGSAHAPSRPTLRRPEPIRRCRVYCVQYARPRPAIA